MYSHYTLASLKLALGFSAFFLFLSFEKIKKKIFLKRRERERERAKD